MYCLICYLTSWLTLNDHFITVWSQCRQTVSLLAVIGLIMDAVADAADARDDASRATPKSSVKTK